MSYRTPLVTEVLNRVPFLFLSYALTQSNTISISALYLSIRSTSWWLLAKILSNLLTNSSTTVWKVGWTIDKTLKSLFLSPKFGFGAVGVCLALSSPGSSLFSVVNLTWRRWLACGLFKYLCSIFYRSTWGYKFWMDIHLSYQMLSEWVSVISEYLDIFNEQTADNAADNWWKGQLRLSWW